MRLRQVAQLSQRDRAVGWVSFDRNISGIRRYATPNVVGARKLRALIFYTITYEKTVTFRFGLLVGRF